MQPIVFVVKTEESRSVLSSVEFVTGGPHSRATAEGKVDCSDGRLSAERHS